jgi:hypothetical protein
MAGGPPRAGVAASLIPLFQSVLMSKVFPSSIWFFCWKKIKRLPFQLKNNLRYLGVTISRVKLRWEL